MSTDPNQPVDAFGNPIAQAPVDPTVDPPLPVVPIVDGPGSTPLDPPVTPAPVDPAPVVDPPVVAPVDPAPVAVDPAAPVVAWTDSTPLSGSTLTADTNPDPVVTPATDVTSTIVTMDGGSAVDTTKRADGSETVVERASTVEEQLNVVAQDLLTLVVASLPGVSSGSITTSATGFSVTLNKPSGVAAVASPEFERGPLDPTPADSIRHDNAEGLGA